MYLVFEHVNGYMKSELIFELFVEFKKVLRIYGKQNHKLIMEAKKKCSLKYLSVKINLHKNIYINFQHGNIYD